MKFWQALRHMQEDGWECRLVGFTTHYRWFDELGITSGRDVRSIANGTMLTAEWERVGPPKQKRKVTMVRPIRVSPDGIFMNECFHETKDRFFTGLGSYPIVGWESREVEVDCE